MASDIVLILQSEHRQLLSLADRCRRQARGLADPVGELRHLLAAHASVVTDDVLADAAVSRLDLHYAPMTASEVGSLPERRLPEAAVALVRSETSGVLPALAEGLPLMDRRRVGRMYRTRRDARLRGGAVARRRRLSQTELYELARRAGIEHRSQMTQAQLLAALEHAGGRVGTRGDDRPWDV